MNVPPGMEGYEYCELMLHLPFYWIIDRKPENYWPVEWLRRVARYPRENGTWLFYGRLMPGDGPPLSSNTRLNCLTVGATRMLPNTAERDKFIMLDLGVKTVYFFTLLPLYEEEAQYRKDHTAEELFDLFDERDISDIIIPGRRSAAMYEENSKLS